MSIKNSSVALILSSVLVMPSIATDAFMVDELPLSCLLSNSSSSVYVMSDKERYIYNELRDKLDGGMIINANNALCNAAEMGYQAVVELLLDRPANSLELGQQAINDALENAVRYKKQGIVDILLNRPEGSLRPDQKCINKIYCGASDYKYENGITRIPKSHTLINKKVKHGSTRRSWISLFIFCCP